MITVEELRTIPLFASLDEPAMAAIAPHMQRHTFRPGQHIILEGDRSTGLFCVLRGRVRLSRMAPDGREQVLAMISTGEVFNPVPLFDGKPNPATARAMSHVTCLLLPREQLLRLIQLHPTLALTMLADMAGQLRELVSLVEDLAFRSVRARLARHLLVEAAGGTAEITQQELAERTGTVREIAGRALRRLAEEGLVRLERGRVRVLDAEGLARIVTE